MADIDERISAVECARRDLIESLSGIADERATWCPDPDAWSIAQVVEHLVLAEHSGVIRMWQAVASYRNREPGWHGDVVHRGRSIEEIIAVTWHEHEDAPANCVPQANGPLAYWMECLAARQPVLARLGEELHGLDLTTVIAPHFLSGPLDADQRLQFLRWHIVHHQAQIVALVEAADARLAPV